MSIFNSLGSNYSLVSALKHLFTRGECKDYMKLEGYLDGRYDGSAYLFYKGREALRQALLATGLKKGSEVAINGFTCFVVDEAVTEAGFKSVYLDIDENQLHFTAETLRTAVKKNPKIKVVIIQNTLGYPCDIVGIEDVCKKSKLILIEDLAHSFGLIYPDGREAGTVGDMTMLSFGRDKVIDAVSGGALVIKGKVNSKWRANLAEGRHQPKLKDRLLDRIYPLLTWKVRTFYSLGIGKALQVAFKSIGLMPRAVAETLDGFTNLPSSNAKEINRLIAQHDRRQEHRVQIADIYRKIIPKSSIPAVAKKQIGKPAELRFPVLTKDRDELLIYLRASGVHIHDIWYDSPIAPPRYIDQTDYSSGLCKNSEATTGQLMNLPTHRNISVDQATKLAERIAEYGTKY